MSSSKSCMVPGLLSAEPLPLTTTDVAAPQQWVLQFFLCPALTLSAHSPSRDCKALQKNVGGNNLAAAMSTQGDNMQEEDSVLESLQGNTVGYQQELPVLTGMEASVFSPTEPLRSS